MYKNNDCNHEREITQVDVNVNGVDYDNIYAEKCEQCETTFIYVQGGKIVE